MTVTVHPSAKKVVCLGNAVIDFVFEVDTIPTDAGKHRARSFRMVGGGPAATAAVAVSKLGGTAELIARVGDDATAGLITAELEAADVVCRHVRRFQGVTSSVSTVFVDARGERLIVNHLDPSLPGGSDWIPDVAELGADAVLADTRWPAGAFHVLRRAAALGLPGVLDADSPVAPAEEAIASASHIAFSVQGLVEYAGSSDVPGSLTRVAAKTGAWCCVTRGRRGVLMSVDGQLTEVPAFEVNVVDTLGAGDVWHGSFALALAEGRRELDAVLFANAAASLKCKRAGGRAGVPTRTELAAFMARHPEDQSCN